MQNSVFFSTLFLVILWIINYLISWWNARSVGLVWLETNDIGGRAKVLAWAGAVMSASGFAWCYTIIFLIGGYYLSPYIGKAGHPIWIDQEMLEGGFYLGYLILIIPILSSGIIIWIHSLIAAWKDRSLKNVVVAAWNSYAQVHNTLGAVKAIPEAFKKVGKLFKEVDGAKSKGFLLVILLVFSGVVLGILTTWGLINKYSALEYATENQ